MPGRIESGIATLVGALLDLVAPAVCVVCGSMPGRDGFCARGPGVRGLRPWDEAALCRTCARELGPPVTARLVRPGGEHLPVHAAVATGPDVAGIIHAWKYHGQRGLAWPLARTMSCLAATGVPGGEPMLVPVPLHGRRRRRRGFNQADLLARLIAERRGLSVGADVLRRRRSTGQQAKLEDAQARRCNVAGAFAAVPATPDAPPLLLVDDVVTSGATVLAAADALGAGGWRLAGVLAVATSLPAFRPVETFRPVDTFRLVDTQGAGF